MNEQSEELPPHSSPQWIAENPATRWISANAHDIGQWLHDLFWPHKIAATADEDMAFANPAKLIAQGRLIVVLFILVVFGWAGLAPLESALVAPGVVVVESHRKTIQHLEGGIVRAIAVRDGQKVSVGQVLLRLDETQARASLNLLSGEADGLAAEEARLIAERDGAQTITFGPDLLARTTDPKAIEAIRGEEKTFHSRSDALAQQIAILSQRTGENGTIVAGLKKQQAAVEQQMALIQTETDSVQKLYKEGLTPLPRLLALQRQMADLNGQRGQLVEKISQTQLGSGENRLQIENLKSQHMNDVLKDLREVQTQRFDLLDKLHAARDVLARLTISAPVAGKIVSLSVHTLGAVVRPGDPLMEIVPQKDQLEVEAHIRPQDADHVHVGMRARVNLSSYEARRLPIMIGTVNSVSADQIIDQRTGQAYFEVRIAVDRTSLSKFADERLIPGLPAEVSLLTGSRTMLDYIMEPITDVLRRGMREK